MQRASPRLDHWPSVVSHIASVMDIPASARKYRPFLRKCGVRSPNDLLHLALLYGPGGLSLRSSASFAGADFITRVGWRSLNLFDPTGQASI
jgi:hypothetical protein